MDHRPLLLEKTAEFRVPAGTGMFFPAQRFVASSKPGCEVCIGTVFDEFQRRFLSDKKRGLEAHPEMSIQVCSLTRNSTTVEILEHFSDGRVPLVPLSVVFEILRRQPNGEPGPLNTQGLVNIFFVEDSVNMLQTVRTHWFGYGWHIGSYPKSRTIPWISGAKIVLGMEVRLSVRSS